MNCLPTISLYGGVFYGIIPPKPPRNILHLFSQLEFDGESEISSSEHDFNF